MELRIGRRKGTGLDGFPATVFVLTNAQDEELLAGRWWFAWEEAEAERKRLIAELDADGA